MPLPKRAATLIELLIVVVIIGVLATLGYVNYAPIREDALDREARANLELIMAAQRIYRMETGFYYDSSGGQPAQIAGINTALKLSLPSAGSRNWDFITDAVNAPTPGTSVCVETTRTDAGARTWVMRQNYDEPQSGETCP